MAGRRRRERSRCLGANREECEQEDDDGGVGEEAAAAEAEEGECGGGDGDDGAGDAQGRRDGAADEADREEGDDAPEGGTGVDVADRFEEAVVEEPGVDVGDGQEPQDGAPRDDAEPDGGDGEERLRRAGRVAPAGEQHERRGQQRGARGGERGGPWSAAQRIERPLQMVSPAMPTMAVREKAGSAVTDGERDDGDDQQELDQDGRGAPLLERVAAFGRA